MKEIWKNCEEIMDQLAKEKQQKIESIIEEVAQLKFEKIAEIKAGYDMMIKRLELVRKKDAAEIKEIEKRQNILEEN